VTTYTAGGFFRIAVEKGRADRVIKLQGRALGLPDGLRPLGRKSFLLVEGAGTLDRVEVDGDRFRAEPLRAGFRTPISVTRVGSVVWVSEGQMPLFFDPARKGQSPALPFRIYAVPLNKGRVPMKFDRTSYPRAFGALSAALLSAQPALAQTTTYPTVTDARLEHPDADWLMHRRTYDGSGFSPLKQITSSNVSHPTLA
jgi:hypothetical protein